MCIEEINYQENITTLIAVPNPVTIETIIYFPFEIKGISNLELTSINGNLIMKKVISSDMSFYKLDFIPDKKGVYMFMVYNNGMSLKCRLVVL